MAVTLPDAVTLTDLEVSAERIAELESALLRARDEHEHLIRSAMHARHPSLPAIARAARVSCERVRRIARTAY